MSKLRIEVIDTNDVKPGDRLNAGFGICTVRGIKVGGDRITWYWEEDQPAVTQHRSNSVERVVD